MSEQGVTRWHYNRIYPQLIIAYMLRLNKSVITQTNSNDLPSTNSI